MFSNYVAFRALKLSIVCQRIAVVINGSFSITCTTELLMVSIFPSIRTPLLLEALSSSAEFCGTLCSGELFGTLRSSTKLFGTLCFLLDCLAHWVLP